MDTVVGLICVLLTIYWVIMFARIILSWIPPPMSGFGRTLYDLIHDLTEPLMRLVRGLLPPIRMGTVGLDLSPIVIFIALAVIRRAIGCGGLSI
ncbi:MAG: YggT family protein [Actinomycetota bacterium]